MSAVTGVLLGGSVRSGAGGGRARRLVAFVLVVGACVLAGPIVGQAQAATRRHGHQLHRPRHQRPDRDRGGARRRAVVHQPREQLDRADHHHRHVTNYTGTAHQRPVRDRGGARRRAVVHQRREQLDRADHHHAARSPTTPARHQRAGSGSRRGPTARCGSPTTGTTRSGGSADQRGTSPTTPTPASAARSGSRRGPTARCGSPTTAIQLDRADHHHRHGHQLHRPRHQRARSGSRRGPTARCGSPTHGNDSIGRITTDRHGHQLHRPRHQQPARDRGGARRRAVVHQRTGTTRSGGSPPPGRVTNYTGPSISIPVGIAAGPDGGMWFTNHGNNSIGRIQAAGYAATVSSTPGLLAYWRLGESSGTTAVDELGAHNGTYVGGHTLGVPGALQGDANTAVGLDGSSGQVQLPSLGTASNWTVEGWTDLNADASRARPATTRSTPALAESG